LYLGLLHPVSALTGWPALTTGLPAALEEASEAGRVEHGLARLQGLERSSVLPSTLHVFVDLLAREARAGRTLLVDDGAYAIAQIGAERAACAGRQTIRWFHSHDPDALAAAVRSVRPARAAVILDGVDIEKGTPAPLREYLAVIGGEDRLVVDDTQALGILGPGGGGSAARDGIRDDRLLVAASLAKGFGVPVAALSGSARTIAAFERGSELRVHASPPSRALLIAAERALAVNAAAGEVLRAQLADRIGRFRAGVAALGVRVAGGPFPVQTLELEPETARHLYARLAALGVRAVLRAAGGGRLTFLITARHRAEEIDDALARLEAALGVRVRAS
jgi:8-amino-7-oxononanoate synthase